MIHLSSPLTVTIPAGNEVKAALANSRCAVAIMGAPRTRAEALDAMRAVGNLLHGIHRHLVVVDGENGLSMDELDVVLRGKNRPIILGSIPFSEEVLTSILFSLNLLFQVCQYLEGSRLDTFLHRQDYHRVQEHSRLLYYTKINPNAHTDLNRSLDQGHRPSLPRPESAFD